MTLRSRTVNILALSLVALSVSACGLTGPKDGAKASDQARDAGFDVAGDRPATPKTLTTMSRLLINQRRYDEAEKLLKQAVAQTPAYLPAFTALAELQISTGRPDDALATLRTAIAAAPNDALLHNDAGMCYLTKKDYDNALVSFTRAVELDARPPRYRANRAMALGMLGKYEEALAAYATVLSPADAHYNLAILCRLRGDLDRATAESAQADALKNTPATPLPVSTPSIPTPTPQG